MLESNYALKELTLGFYTFIKVHDPVQIENFSNSLIE